MRLARSASVAVSVVGVLACQEEGTTDPCRRPEPGMICSVAGTGYPGLGADKLAALETTLYTPFDVAFSPAGVLHVLDWNNHLIRALGADGRLTIIAGEKSLGGPVGADDGVSEKLNHPTDLAWDPQGRLLVAAWHQNRIKFVDTESHELVDTCGTGMRGFSGDGGPAIVANLNLPSGITYDAEGNLIISDQGNARVRKVDGQGVIRTIAGTGELGFSGDGGPALSASFRQPFGMMALPAGHIALDGEGNLFIADTGNRRVRKIDVGGTITTVAGDGTPGWRGDGGPATEAQLSRITDVAVGPDGALYIADTENNCVRVVRDGIIDTVAGQCGSCSGVISDACNCVGGEPSCLRDGGPAREALLRHPFGIAFDRDGNLYIADSLHHRIRVVYR
jgi:sugar lactone lactonase YvrE